MELSDTPYKVQFVCKDTNYHYDVWPFEDMVNALVNCKRMMIPSARGHLFGSAVPFGQW